MNKNSTKPILLVEDDALIAMSEKRLLEKHGYHVITARSGEEAIDVVASDPGISLILMDIDLGSGIDGTEAAERILEMHDLPIAFLSSHTEPEVVEKTEGITSYGYILKNSGETVLLASVKMAFRLYEAHMELKKRTEELDRYFKSSLDLLCIANTGGEFIRLNPQWEKALGYSVAELEGRSFLEFVHPEDREATSKAVAKLEAEEDVAGFENRFRSRDGSYRWIEWRSRPIGSEIYAAARDVTERKAAEDALLEREALYRNLMESSIDGVELLDEEGRFLNVNQKECEMLGYSREELLGMKIADIDPNYPEDGFYHFWKEQPKGSSVLFETLHRHKDGTLIPVEVNGIFFTVNTKKYIFGVARDIRERKQSEHHMKIQKEHLQVTLNSIGDAVISTDIEGHVVRMNPVAECLCGWSIDEARGKALEEVFRIVRAGTREKVENPVAKVLETGTIVGLANHTVLISKDGTEYHIADSAAPIREDNGPTTGVVLVFRDVSDEYRVAQALAESEREMARAQALAQLGSWRFDLSSGTVSGSEQTRKIYGVNEGELTMDYVQSIPLPEYRPKLDAALKALVEHGTPYDVEFQIRRPADNSVRCIHSVAEYDAQHNHIVGTLQDITERKLAEEALRESEEQLEALFDNSLNPIMIADDAGNYLKVNQAAADMFNYPVEQMLQMNVRDLQTVSSPDAYSRYQEYLRKGYDIGEFEFVRPDTSRGVAQYHAIRVRDNFNLSILSEFTERKQAEEETQRQLSEKETLLKEVHHRIKNNMAQVEGLLFLQVESTDNPAVQAALQEAISRVRSIGVIYEKLLMGKDYQDISVKDYVESLVASIVAVFAGHKNISMETSVADFTLSSQRLIPIGIIINELLTNVFKYAFPERDEGHIALQLDTTGTHATLSIEDDGVGLGDSVATTGSTGFGVKIVQMLVEGLKGNYSVETGNGRRSVLEFEL